MRDDPLFSLLEQARGLSSGTLATVSGFSRYDQIDRVRIAFIEFCEECSQFKTWQPAWRSFWSLFQTTSEFREIARMSEAK